MLRTLLKLPALLFTIVGLLMIATITVVDRTPYAEEDFYAMMDRRLDSLHSALQPVYSTDTLWLGWARVSITPSLAVPLAGYGSRDPKTMTGVHDSASVRTVVFRQGMQKAAFITADLLIIHPELARQVWKLLPGGWSAGEVYFSATHTHSGPGGWAPGMVGEGFAGRYDPPMVSFLAQQIVHSLRQAEARLSPGRTTFREVSADTLVKNRLAGPQGITDPWLKVLQLQTDQGKGYLTFFSAHATCLGHEFRELSADYPGRLVSLLEADTAIQFAAYGAGAVGSMAPAVVLDSDLHEVEAMARELKEQVDRIHVSGGKPDSVHLLRAFQLAVPLRDPYLKLTTNLALRPYLFHRLVGQYQAYIRVLQIGNTLMIGLPCDFSGELAVPLYEKARDKDLNLIITSFNGEYIGYVIKDAWYDLPKYESKTMSWYGPDAGSYFSEIISRIIDATEHNQTDAAGRRDDRQAKHPAHGG